MTSDHPASPEFSASSFPRFPTSSNESSASFEALSPSSALSAESSLSSLSSFPQSPPSPLASAPRLLLGSTEDVLGAVPYLLGFHPTDSLVVIGLTGSPPRIRLHLTVRWDLPLGSGGLGQIVPLFVKEGVAQVILVGYGLGPLVTPAVDEAVALFRRSDLVVVDALRVEGGRYWSYECARTDCCPADGVPYERRADAVAAEAVLHGLVALPDRQTLERSLDPVTGPARQAMSEATDRLTAELRDRLARCRDADGFAAEFVADGMARVREAIVTYASGGRLGEEQAARLGIDLAVIRIRDEAWTLVGEESHEAHLRLWHDLTRRLEPRFVPPAASLLGLVAWQRGDSALAGIALTRAHEANPGYSMAHLLAHAIHHLVPPHALNGRMPSPEELDREMGTPRMAWLLPMAALLEKPGGPASEGAATGARH
ncbi:DUF4192 domain-containing protein [Streptosporangium sp. NPDC000095]|uniref:DUF4192 domain-containing protein n=1 Tax=Streptosporangium sp. NPDC000095 TaxID=3366184 RepID=UPI003691518C